MYYFQAERISYDANRRLLLLVKKKGQKAFQYFLAALEQTGQSHLVEHMRNRRAAQMQTPGLVHLIL